MKIIDNIFTFIDVIHKTRRLKKSVILILILFIATQLQAQQQPPPKDSIILRRFFHSIGRGFKKIDQHAKTVALNSKQHYHDTPHSTNTIDKRFSMALIAGANYYGDFGQKYFPLDTGQLEHEVNYSSATDALGNVSFTYYPGFGLHAGLVCSLRITRSFSFEGGLMYFSVNSKYVKSTDSVERNMVNRYNSENWLDLDSFKVFYHNVHQIEIPIYFGYTNKRFSALAGVKFIMLSIDHWRTIFLDNSVQISNYKHFPFERYTEPIEFIKPSIKIRYMINRKKVPVSIYFSADWLYYNEWDFLAGVQVGIFSR